MRHSRVLMPALLSLLAACSNQPTTSLADSAAATQPPYPASRTVKQIDQYDSASQGKVRIADPYRWLE
ncbi:MAG: hypothetical protein KDI69_08305, partial [Xanthomonadales bacterium]|nr:hypothetical protein [Xanthomonadales bacterium]